MLGVRRELWKSAMQKDGYCIMTISPLDQLYLDTTSKEDLLAEINDQRRQVVEARGLAAELSRKLLAVDSERSRLVIENDQLKKREKAAINKLHRVRKSHKIKPSTITSEITRHILNGLSNQEIEKMGYNLSTIKNRRGRINAIEKAAQSI